jgi:hypothetical protein
LFEPEGGGNDEDMEHAAKDDEDAAGEKVDVSPESSEGLWDDKSFVSDLRGAEADAG